MIGSTYRSKIRFAAGLALGGAVAAGIVAGRLVRLDGPGENFWLIFPAAVAVCWLALAGTLPWWRKLDAMQKDAHLVSWYWGGMAGGMAVLMALATSAGIRSDLARGGGLMLVGQGIAFLIFFMVWKWRHRGPEA